ncbi:MAG: aminotransferase class I/II-fold pyridoxal phosphate-dependent enzyme [Candidatus Thorarchaeota archaeon]|nr:aminotransferase class I/II-fold pyridoxal phosphate-dependent enzyme [Candidatus Thorarchaeota archaeon]
MKTIDLRSDTVTKPTDEMIQAILNAHKEDRFGDDVIGEDEVVNELQEKAARILGKEAALLVTSGTQGNVISLLAQTKRGDEIIVEEQSHTFMFEGGAMSVLGGLYPRPVKGVNGYILPETLRDAIRPDDAHYPRSGMVVVENTHNYAGGTVTTPQQVKELAEVARQYNLRIHCDGARLFNAAVALNVPAKKLVADTDSVQICLSKGLSAPIGSIVAGTEEFIHDAHKLRKKLGGGMRQAGIIAAPGIVALEKMVDRLKEDHVNAKLLYSHLSKIPGLELKEPETNIIFIGLQNFEVDVPKLAQELKKRNILIYGAYGTRARLVTHRMVSKEDILRTAEAVTEILAGST